MVESKKRAIRRSYPLSAERPLRTLFIKKKTPEICGEKVPVSILMLKQRGAHCSCLLCFPRALRQSRFLPSCL